MELKELKVQLDPEEQEPDLKAKKRVLSRVIQGNWNTAFKGQGMEFAGFRAYTFEDDASSIDWRASLRSDRVLVREHEEYKALNVYVVVDVSDTMLFSSGDKLKAEYAAEIAYDLCDSIAKTGDAVGFGMVTSDFNVRFPPDIGVGLTMRIRNELKKKENYGGKSDLLNILKMMSAYAQEPALVILISDFIGLEEGWKNYINIVSQKMDIVGIMIRDPRDRDFPSLGGQFILQEPSEGESMVVDTSRFREAYKKQVVKEEEIIEGAFHKTNSGFIKLTTGKEIYDPLIAEFSRLGRIKDR